MTEQIGLHKFRLTQKQYEAGSFYLSIILDGEQVRAFDARFFVEEGNKLIPTKKGFRIPLENLNDLNKVLSGDLREIADVVLFENKSFQFRMRYINDKYGEGIDFRKFKTTAKYTGWAKSGLRMKLEDVATVHDWLSDINPQEMRIDRDIFSGKNIGIKDRANVKDRTTSKNEFSSGIREILDFE
jgi:hypothetical protein